MNSGDLAKPRELTFGVPSCFSLDFVSHSVVIKKIVQIETDLFVA